MTPHKRSPVSEPHLNGNDTDWAALRDLPEYQMLIEVAQRSLDVFQEIGKLTAASIRAEASADQSEAAVKKVEDTAIRIEASITRSENAVTRSENAANRCEKSLERCEALIKKAMPSVPPPPMPGDTINKKKSPSMVDIMQAEDEDDTKITKLKNYTKEMENEAVIAANDVKRIKKFTLVAGAFLLLCAIIGIVWGVFRYAVNHANESIPVKPNVELSTG